MVFTIKPSLMPSPKRIFHWEVKETAVRVNLKTHAPDNLSVVSTGLVF
jgi:hypothetical protein